MPSRSPFSDGFDSGFLRISVSDGFDSGFLSEPDFESNITMVDLFLESSFCFVGQNSSLFEKTNW